MIQKSIWEERGTEMSQIIEDNFGFNRRFSSGKLLLKYRIRAALGAAHLRAFHSSLNNRFRFFGSVKLNKWRRVLVGYGKPWYLI